MSTTSPLSDAARIELLRQHDGCLEALSLNRAQRRQRGIRARREAIEQHLWEVGMAIAQDAPAQEQPIYASAAEFLEANPE